VRGGARAGVLLSALAACGGERPRPPSPEPALASAVARVADMPIPASLVASVVDAQGVPARSALDALVEDALAARGALDRHLDGERQVALASEVALARRVPLQVMAEARAGGAPTADELQVVTVMQALVARSPSLPEDDALAVANNVERAVAGSRTAEDFDSRVKSLPWQHARLIAQRVGPFGIDGRTPGGDVIDKTFVAAAFALRTPLQISGVVATSFGWHVIQLLSREPPQDISPERGEALAGAAIEIRARSRLAALLQLRRSRTPVDVSHDAESLMAAATGAAP
jgi:hypothetical protein